MMGDSHTSPALQRSFSTMAHNEQESAVDSPLPAKRRRIACDTSHDVHCKDTKLYFDDGDVTICAIQRDGPIVQFRVHRSILERHCPKVLEEVTAPFHVDPFDDIEESPTSNGVGRHICRSRSFLPATPDGVRAFLSMIYEPL